MNRNQVGAIEIEAVTLYDEYWREPGNERSKAYHNCWVNMTRYGDMKYPGENNGQPTFYVVREERFSGYWDGEDAERESDFRWQQIFEWAAFESDAQAQRYAMERMDKLKKDTQVFINLTEQGKA